MPARFGGGNACQHLFEPTAPADAGKAVRIQAVEADIDPTDIGLCQHLCMVSKQAAVGRQGQFIQPTRCHIFAKMSDQLANIAAHKRFATGQADAPYAVVDKTLGNQRDFGIVEQFAAGQKLLLLGHAIVAAKIAPVGHRYSQIIYCPSETIAHKPHLSVLLSAGNGCERLCC